MESTDAAALRKLLDRQEILDCITRYCRGVDRLDGDLLRSAYHPDGIDDHGIFVGRRDDWVTWVLDLHAKHQFVTQHVIANHYCELDGDVAHTETYFLFAGLNKQGPRLTLTGGRYVDRFERRDGVWAIAARKCVIEWRDDDEASPLKTNTAPLYDSVGVRARDRNDMSYERPLQVDLSRLGFRFDA